MPEGPEVKLTVDKISQKLINKQIVKAEILRGKYFEKNQIPFWDEFLKLLPLKILNVSCHGKFIYICLANGFAIGIGLGMSGRLHFKTNDNDNHLRFTLDDNHILCFDDYRRFGNIVIYQNQDKLNQKLESLGLNILETKLDKSMLIKIYQKYLNQNICKFLMNQQIFSGIGNYLKCEALYQNRISPLTTLKQIPEEIFISLINSCQNLARQSYLTQKEFKSKYGSNHEGFNFQVYGRLTDPFGNKVLKIKTPDQRNTSYVKERQLIGDHQFILDQKQVVSNNDDLIILDDELIIADDSLIVDD